MVKSAKFSFTTRDALLPERIPHARNFVVATTALTDDSPAVLRDDLVFSFGGVEAYTGVSPHPLIGQTKPTGKGGGTWDADDTEFYEVQLPPGYRRDRATKYPLVLGLPALGGNHEQVRNFASAAYAEAAARGMIFVSGEVFPGLGQNWAYENSAMLHLDALISYLVASENVDEDRIYVLGHSRGGHTSGTWASKRRDPDFYGAAAVALNAPLCDSLQWYLLLDPSTSGGGGSDSNAFHRAFQERPDNANGVWGASTAIDHRYRTAGMIYLSSGTYSHYPSTAGGGTVDTLHSSGVNLAMLPVWMVWNTEDITLILPHQCDTLKTLIETWGGTVDGPGEFTDADPDLSHTWANFAPYSDVFDWFDGKLRSDTIHPSQGAIVDDDDRTYGAYTITRDSATSNAFVSYLDTVNGPTFVGPNAVDTITIDRSLTLYATKNPLPIVCAAPAAGSSPDIHMTGVPNPSSVTGTGVSSWSWAANTLEIVNSTGGLMSATVTWP